MSALGKYSIREISLERDLMNLDGRILRLPPGRRRKALSLVREVDRMQSVMVYELLSDLLSQRFGIEEFVMEEDLSGKPYLADRPGLHVSLSHCQLAVMAAVSADGAVGCDVEMTGYDPEVAAICCLPGERALIDRSSDRPEAFTRIWTLKESIFKIDNTLDISAIDTASLSDRYAVDTEVRSGYVATVVSYS